MNSAIEARGRLQYLDSARGFAALSVMIHHFIVTFELTAGLSDRAINPTGFFYYGQAAVLFFFIHSGFILSYSLSNRVQITKSSAYIRFIVERVFRIYPLFIFVVLLSYALKQAFFPLSNPIYTTTHLRIYWVSKIDLIALVKELTLLPSINNGSTRMLVPQEWTAAIEIAVGLLIPLLLYFLKKIKRSWLYWLVVLFVIKILKFNTFLFDFALGVFLFYHMEEIKKIWRKAAVPIKWLLPGAAVLCFTCFFQFASLFNTDRVFIKPGVDHAIVSLGCSLFFCLLISSTVLQRILAHPWLIHMGRICYSLYLVHMMILILFSDYAVRLLRQVSGLPVSICILLFFIFYLTLVFTISLLTYRFVEKPLNLLGKRLAKKAALLVVSAENRFFRKASRHEG